MNRHRISDTGFPGTGKNDEPTPDFRAGFPGTGKNDEPTPDFRAQKTVSQVNSILPVALLALATIFSIDVSP